MLGSHLWRLAFTFGSRSGLLTRLPADEDPAQVGDMAPSCIGSSGPQSLACLGSVW